MSIIVTNVTWWEELCRRANLPTNGRGKKKRRSEKWWDAQAQSVFLLHDLDALPRGAQDAVHRCEWRTCLVASPPCVSYLHFSPYSTASLFIELPQTIPKELCVSLWQAFPFVLNTCEKDGKSLLCASASQSDHLPFWCACEDWGKAISRISICEPLEAWEVCKTGRKGEDAF